MSAIVLAEFSTPAALLAATVAVRGAGHVALDAFTPYPVHGLEAALGLRRSPLTWIVLPFALAGASAAYLIQFATSVVDYPLVAGARPPHASPAFVPITFEMGVLSASLAGLGALLWLCRLPRLHHPLFDVEGFERASIDRFWLAASQGAGGADVEALEALLEGLGASRVVRKEWAA